VVKEFLSRAKILILAVISNFIVEQKFTAHDGHFLKSGSSFRACGR